MQTVIGPNGFDKFRSLALGAVLVITTSGCGNTLYAIAANSASSKVEEALLRQMSVCPQRGVQ